LICLKLADTKQLNIKRIICILLLACAVSLPADTSFAQEFTTDPMPALEGGIENEGQLEVNKAEPKLVIINPGHGGSDLGARSPKNFLEKNINLRLAKLIKKKFSFDKEIEIRLTRQSDRSIEFFRRVEIANTAKSELYISIHCDGGVGPRKSAVRLFINKPAAAIKLNDWKSNNNKNDRKNSIIAEKLFVNLKDVVGRNIEIVPTNLLYLGGLSMPAIVIESIDLSNPEDEIRLRRDDHLINIADAIAKGIRGYFVATDVGR